MSDTPRTDAAEYECVDEPVMKLGSVDADFARQLERELNAANANVERLTKSNLQLREGCEELKQRINHLETENDELRAALLLWDEKEAKP